MSCSGWAAWPARSTKPTTAPGCPRPGSRTSISSPHASIAPPMPANPWRVWASTWMPSRPWWTKSSSAASFAPASQWHKAPPLGTDKTAMDFRRLLPEIRWQSCLSPGPLRDRPALAHRGHEVLVGLHVVGDLHLRRIVLHLAFHPKSDYAEQHPLHEWRRHVEVGTRRVASLAGADPIPVVPRRPRQ